MTMDELKKYNGRNGAKAYVAYNNVIYDVTESPLWQEGDHEGIHFAGEDLTSQLTGAPHGAEVFEGFTAVDTLEVPESQTNTNSETEISLKYKLKKWYQYYHPHPMTVHFPIALHLFAAAMDLLFLFNHKEAYALSVFYVFFVSTVMGFVAMVPGVLSWWVNYDFSTSQPFIIKVVISTLVLLLGIINIVLYLNDPMIVYHDSLEGIIYHTIVLFTGFCVIVLGYYGGKITWGNASAYTKTNSKNQNSSSTQALYKSQGETIHTLINAHYNLSLLIGGSAGSGIDTIEKILTDAFKASGYYVFSTKEYMSRVRGGSNSTLIRISDRPLKAPVWEVDLSIALDEMALTHMQERYTENTLVLADVTEQKSIANLIYIAINERAKALGGRQYANTYMAGVVFGLLELELDTLLQSIDKYFKDDSENIKIAQEGFKDGAVIEHSTIPKLPSNDLQNVEKLHLMDGTTACGFGFLAGGCNMVTSYPMSPSTGVLNFMAARTKEFTIVVEQSEDEIASLNMVLGGWYAGARAMTTTSGGGFALMSEALSLSGMSETPAVIYLAQRPGPATGLPTRTEQGDLNMAIYTGHGPFERIVLAPGTLEACIECGYLAFELADKYQVPVIFLSDQYLADSMSTIATVDFSQFKPENYIIQSEEGYQRFADTPDGISPRSVPGLGEGLVCAVGDEHDEAGQITESHQTRIQMVHKRARKHQGVLQNALMPKIAGNGDIAIIGWGSSYGAINEALLRLDDPRLSHVHFDWVYPLSDKQLDHLNKYRYRIVVENNATGIFADQLKLHDIKIDKKILQYNGFAFFADQLTQLINEQIKEL
ncbi:2-oxoacid:acceptor oxidoreductase subunit alpha [Sulfurovum sp. zt1-1]|uniref:2-oxoacid:acceptor oxidoreductase subunit alpha n=1 Tax=Sulfurovum zhangzhouensis TaxID=3019067 RepID=A0ABT7QVR6_9BACT|nr:2-oxoacid:acceptor oxidoreductase subunit alpha [Sulfurovum zhangzhouensis]MDM5270925.1 2-oxoacid:acceptor oxidoreductase subunit alpha [Sulfurovum zhangzhouensis]